MVKTNAPNLLYPLVDWTFNDFDGSPRHSFFSERIFLCACGFAGSTTESPGIVGIIPFLFPQRLRVLLALGIRDVLVQWGRPETQAERLTAPGETIVHTASQQATWFDVLPLSADLTMRAGLRKWQREACMDFLRTTRPPPFTNRELPGKNLGVVNARLVVVGRVLLLGWTLSGLASDAVAQPGSKADPESALRLTGAAEQGTFNIGAGKANLSRVVDPVVSREVFKLDFSLPVGTAVGVWAKNFASPIGSENIDVAQIGVRVDGSGLEGLAAAMEIKGSGGSQRTAIPLTAAWSLTEAAINWQLVGAFSEAVVVVSQAGSKPVTGTVFLDVRFDRLSPARKLSTHVTARLGGVLIVSFAGALLTALLGRFFRPKRSADACDMARVASTPGRLAGLRRDFVIGAGLILIGGLAISIYGLSTEGILEGGWSALAAAVAGAVIAEWLKVGLTGKHQDPLEVFLNMAATGFLVASASSLAILQAPAAWSELLILSGTAAAGTVLLYHLINAGMLAGAGKHLSAVSAVLIVGAPLRRRGVNPAGFAGTSSTYRRSRSRRRLQFAGVARVDRPGDSSLLF